MRSVRKPIKELKRRLTELYGPKLKEILLFGSWARNEGTTESDIDLLIILEDDIIPGQEIDRMIDIITDINLAYNTLISVIPVSKKSYNEVNSPLFLNVRKEGIPL